MRTPELTDLEHTVLGVLWRDGASTPYRLRREFLDSPIPSWSGSAGSIYPLVRRLEREGLLASEDSASDRRGTRLYDLTPAGRRALKRWLLPPLPRRDALPGVDAVRSRLLFLQLLTARERARFLAQIQAQLDDAVTELRAIVTDAEEGGDQIHVLASRGGLKVAEARCAWFSEVCVALGE